MAESCNHGSFPDILAYEKSPARPQYITPFYCVHELIPEFRARYRRGAHHAIQGGISTGAISEKAVPIENDQGGKITRRTAYATALECFADQPAAGPRCAWVGRPAGDGRPPGPHAKKVAADPEHADAG